MRRADGQWRVAATRTAKVGSVLAACVGDHWRAGIQYADRAPGHAGAVHTDGADVGKEVDAVRV